MTTEWFPILAALAALIAGVAKIRSQRGQAFSGEGPDGSTGVRLEIGGRILTVQGPVNAQLLASLARDLASAPAFDSHDESRKVANQTQK